MKRGTTVLAALALVLVLSAGIGTALAYFTTYAEARGGKIVELGDRTTVTERPPVNWVKHVTITSDADSEPVYVRARAFAGSAYTLAYSGEGWTPDADGWVYYGPAVAGGGSTAELNVEVGGVPADAAEGDSFNVAVVYETTPVQYDAAGAAFADWSYTLDSGAEGGA